MLRTSLIFLCLSFYFNSFAIDGILLKTLDYSFQDKWYNTIGGDAPIFSTPEHVFKGQSLFITVIISNFDTSKENRVNVKLAVKIIKPDNSIHFFQENIPIIDNEVVNGKYFHMSNSILKIIFEEKDMFGKYKIEANITDINVNKSVLLASDIDLKVLPKYEKTNIDDDTFSKWLSNYYRTPSPEKALGYYIHFFETSRDEDRFIIISTFFVEIFKNNHFLLPQIKEAFKNKKTKDKKPLLYLLKMSGIKEKEFLDLFSEQEKTSFSEFEDFDIFAYMYGDISHPLQLDMLWSVFFASGSYQPILKLIQTLEYVKYDGELEKYKTSTTKTEEEKVKAINNAIYTSLVWSLQSNAEQHKLVRNFLNWALKHEKLSVVQKKELEKVLEK